MLAATAVAVLGSELAVRIVAPQPKSWLEIYRTHPQLRFPALLPNAEQHADTGETRWTVHTDALGFRCGAGPSGVTGTRVIWLGDSFTFGHGVDFDECFVGRIAGWGRDGTRHWNTGVPGYGPTQYQAVLEHYAPELTPDVVMVCLYVGNDFHDCMWRKDTPIQGGVIGRGSGIKGLIKAHSHLYRLLAATMHKLGLGSQASYSEIALQLRTPKEWQAPFLTEAVARTGEALRAMAAYASSSGIPLRAVVIPTREAVAGSGLAGAAGEDPQLPVARTRDILAELNIEFCDTTPVLREMGDRAAYLEFDGHLTPAANEAVARALVARWPDLVGRK